MVKSIVVNSYPSVPMHILSKPHFSVSPPPSRTLGQTILGRDVARVSQMVVMGHQSQKVKDLLQLPEAEPVKVIKGYEKMVDEGDFGKTTDSAPKDLQEASKQFFDSVKQSKDDSYDAEPSTVTEKNEATLSTALAAVQEPYRRGRKTSHSLPKKSKKATTSLKKKPAHFKIVSKKKK